MTTSATEKTRGSKTLGVDAVGISVGDVLAEVWADLTDEEGSELENGGLDYFTEKAFEAVKEARESPACIVDWRPILVKALKQVLKLAINIGCEIDFCDCARIDHANFGQPGA